METIKKKILLLHSDLSDALFSAGRAQEQSEAKTKEAKDLEVRERDLMKAIATKVRSQPPPKAALICMHICRID